MNWYLHGGMSRLCFEKNLWNARYRLSLLSAKKLFDTLSIKKNLMVLLIISALILPTHTVWLTFCDLNIKSFHPPIEENRKRFQILNYTIESKTFFCNFIFIPPSLIFREKKSAINVLGSNILPNTSMKR